MAVGIELPRGIAPRESNVSFRCKGLCTSHLIPRGCSISRLKNTAGRAVLLEVHDQEACAAKKKLPDI